jgi:hypothetical protein
MLFADATDQELLNLIGQEKLSQWCKLWAWNARHELERRRRARQSSGDQTGSDPRAKSQAPSQSRSAPSPRPTAT